MTEAAVTREQWAKAFLNEVGAPLTVRNLRAIVSWLASEGSIAHFNPLATTKVMPGSWAFNSVGVQNYATFGSGMEATVLTIRERGHNYEPILRRLRKNAWAINTVRAIGASEWGTNLLLLLRVLMSVRVNYGSYANRVIG